MNFVISALLAFTLAAALPAKPTVRPQSSARCSAASLAPCITLADLNSGNVAGLNAAVDAKFSPRKTRSVRK